MIDSIEFKNFKVLRDATLPLGRCTILVGPNGSGKSTVLQALESIRDPRRIDAATVLSIGATDRYVEIRLNAAGSLKGWLCRIRWEVGKERPSHQILKRGGPPPPDNSATEEGKFRYEILRPFRVYAFEARAIAEPALVCELPKIQRDGSGLAAVLDGIRDVDAERFNAINSQLSRWLPEFENICFDKPKEGCKSIVLQTRQGHHRIPAVDLSQGTLIVLALLTLAYLPEPPSLVALEEPDRGIHPRLLRRVQDAMYRMAYPEDSGEHREPVQVIATTHSPCFLDLFKDHPDEIVMANKVGLNAKFERLSERPDIDEILRDAPLGEAWYSGVLGGVPSEP